MKGKAFFITGGLGFIGANLIAKLHKENEIIIYDNSLRISPIINEIEKHNLKIIKGDILDYETLKKSIPLNTNYIIHLAAITGIDTVIKDPTKTLETNIIGTYNLLKAVLEKGIIDNIERFVNFSTSEVFGVFAFNVDEEQPTNLQPVGEARWTYAVSKVAGEHLVHGYYKVYKLKAVTIRPFNIYGPGQVGESAMSRFINQAITNQPLYIHGDGNQIRSWCYIDDLLQGVMLCLEKPEAIGQVLNIGNPRGTITILSLAEKIIQLANSKSQIIHVPKNYVDVELRIPSIEKAQRILGYQPQVSLNEGIKKTIEWYKTHKINTTV